MIGDGCLPKACAAVDPPSVAVRVTLFGVGVPSDATDVGMDDEVAVSIVFVDGEATLGSPVGDTDTSAEEQDDAAVDDAAAVDDVAAVDDDDNDNGTDDTPEMNGFP